MSMNRAQKMEKYLEDSIGELAEYPLLIGSILIGSLIVAIIFGVIYRCGK